MKLLRLEIDNCRECPYIWSDHTAYACKMTGRWEDEWKVVWRKSKGIPKRISPPEWCHLPDAGE